MTTTLVPTTTLLLLATLLLSAAAAAAAAATPTPTSEFIRTSCLTTQYPTLCEQSLSTYAPIVHRSPRQLAHAALTVSAAHARSASAFVSRVSATSPRASRERGAVRDCVETLDDSLDQLRRSVRELRRMGRKGSERFQWHLSNAQTWVSAALTDESTCLDSLAEDRAAAGVRAAIRERIQDVARVTSNALALVNRLGQQH